MPRISVAQLHSLPEDRIDARELLRKDALFCAEAYASCSTGCSIPRPRSKCRRICSLCIHDIKLHNRSYHIGDERHFSCLRQQDFNGVCELNGAGATARCRAEHVLAVLPSIHHQERIFVH
jgi:hypothetical protein